MPGPGSDQEIVIIFLSDHVRVEYKLFYSMHAVTVSSIVLNSKSIIVLNYKL